jgi:hypothetical protein
MTDQTPVQTLDQTPLTTGAESDADALSPATEGDGTGEVQPNREMRYRLERNSAREEVASLSARIERMNRLDIERLASDTLSAPVDFWLSGNDVSSYLDDNGNVDIHRVREDAKLLVSERPGLSKNRPAIDHSQGLGGGNGKPALGWSALLKD